MRNPEQTAPTAPGGRARPGPSWVGLSRRPLSRDRSDTAVTAGDGHARLPSGPEGLQGCRALGLGVRASRLAELHRTPCPLAMRPSRRQQGGTSQVFLNRHASFLELCVCSWKETASINQGENYPTPWAAAGCQLTFCPLSGSSEGVHRAVQAGEQRTPSAVCSFSPRGSCSQRELLGNSAQSGPPATWHCHACPAGPEPGPQQWRPRHSYFQYLDPLSLCHTELGALKAATGSKLCFQGQTLHPAGIPCLQKSLRWERMLLSGSSLGEGAPD